MKSLPDEAGEARRAWLYEMQGDPQSDFEKSVVWRGVFVAAVIVTVINIPASPPPSVNSGAYPVDGLAAR